MQKMKAMTAKKKLHMSVKMIMGVKSETMCFVMGGTVSSIVLTSFYPNDIDTII